MKKDDAKQRKQAHAPDRSAAVAAFQEHLVRRGLRRSTVRELIVDTFLSVTGHISVEELTARVREREQATGQASVYRALKLLEECGVAGPRQFADGVTRYELDVERSHHDHLVCTSCGDIVEFENAEIEALQLAVAQSHGFAVESHRMDMYGRCPRCRERRARRGRTSHA